MKRLLKLIGRFLNDFTESVFVGTMCAVIIFYIVILLDIVMFHDTKAASVTGVLLFLNVIGIISCTAVKLRQTPHKYDADIIGNNFIGPGKKNRIFKNALDCFFRQDLTRALADFKRIETNFAGKMTTKENALVCFYIARCYQLMNYAPNSVRYYELAEQTGAAPEISTFFYARALGENGDTREAVELFGKILSDGNNPFRHFVRTDIGRMYLCLNDGENALKWYDEAMELREDYANALGGAAVAYTILHRFDKGEELFRAAILNNIADPDGFTEYYKRVQAAALTESHTKESIEEKDANCSPLQKINERSS